jgi:hypothetical protein
MEITFESIKPIVHHYEVEGQMVKVKFKAANQEQPIETMAYVAPDQDQMMAEIQKQMGKSMAAGMAVNTAGSLLGNAIGGLAGDLVNEAGSAAASNAASAAFDVNKITQVEMSEQRVQQAIVQAFGYLKTYYQFESGQWKFVSPA